MASKYKLSSRTPFSGQVHVFTSPTITVVDSTTTNLAMDLPPGCYRVVVIVQVVGSSDNTVTITMAPYADTNQSEVGANMGFVVSGAASGVNTVATSTSAGTTNTVLFLTGGTSAVPFPGQAVPLAFGMLVSTVTNAGAGSAVGTYTITAVAVEV